MKQVYDGAGNVIPLSETDKTLSLSGVAADSKTVGNQFQEMAGSGRIEPQYGDVPHVYFTGTLPTSKNDGKKKLRVTYLSRTKTFSEWCTLKVQGASSQTYPKKNYNTVLFHDSAAKDKDKHNFMGWGRTSKFCLKANWMDHTHARNVINARLYGQMCRTRADYESYPQEFKDSPNCACIDGFPVRVWVNGVYHGMYTWNIAKDDFMSNMDDESDKHAMLIAEQASASGVLFTSTSQIDGTDFTDELHEDSVPAWVHTSWDAVQNFVINESDANFKANIERYFYLSSLIDRYIFTVVFIYVGGFAKSQAYYTYDGVKWLSSMYDLDSSWGLRGSTIYGVKPFYPTDLEITPDNYHLGEGTDGYGATNRLFKRIATLYTAEIKQRYNELRLTVLSEDNILRTYDEFMEVYAEYLPDDFAPETADGAYVDIPYKDTNTPENLLGIIHDRLAYTDGYIANL